MTIQGASVAVLHPDLGIGGAERLILDVAMACEIQGYKVDIWTSRYDPNRCFPETHKFPVHVHGNWLPRNIFGLFAIVFALLRNLWLIVRFWRSGGANVIIVDQISAWLGLLKRLCPRSKLVFYCHFPDLLLSRHDTTLRRIYRGVFDWLERRGIRSADVVLVNSDFTRGKVAAEFPGVEVQVLYPTFPALEGTPGPLAGFIPEFADCDVFLSLNRYERKKGHSLALNALALVPDPSARLVVIGGYDTAVSENVQHLEELGQLAQELNIADRVKFIQNAPEELKRAAIRDARAVLYTPINEHFGIVPLEALAAGTPVIACNSGGPCETLQVDGSVLRGCALVEPTREAFAEAMRKVPGKGDAISADLRDRAAYFSFDRFSKRLADFLV